MDALPTLTAAAAVIRALASDLTAALRAKGYPKACALIEIGATRMSVELYSADGITNGPRIFPAYGGPDPWKFCDGSTLDEAAAKARAVIAGLLDQHSADPWFDETHPINQPAPRTPQTCLHCGVNAWDDETVIAVAGGVIHGRCEQYWRSANPQPAGKAA